MSATNVPALDSTLLSRRDLRFLLHEWLRVEELCERPRFAEHSREIFDDVLDLAERVATDRFATHNQKSDEQEPEFDGERVELIPEIGSALDAYTETGFLGAAMDEAVGGMQLPAVIANACFAWFQAANCGTASYPMLTTAAANLLIANGDSAQVQTWVKPLVEGRFFGTMCISETQAGSSVGDATTRAVPQDGGTYRVFGSKMWISGGEHDLSENIVHLVLARLPDAPPGPKGISLVIVPKFLVEEDGSIGERNDVTLAGLNHKMGFRGTVNTVLGFGEGTHRPGGEAGAVGYLVGKPHHGLAYMFHMMNEARLAVGMGAATLGYSGYLKSVQYARERPQGRPRGADPDSRQVPIVEHADVRRMLLTQKSWVEGAMALLLYCGRLVDDEQTAEIWRAGSAEEALANATLYLEAVGHVVVAWLWLEQVLAAGDREDAFYAGKRQAARFFFRYELPRTGPQLDLLVERDRTTLDMDNAWF